jgi:hypothetical protein
MIAGLARVFASVYTLDMGWRKIGGGDFWSRCINCYLLILAREWPMAVVRAQCHVLKL